MGSMALHLLISALVLGFSVESASGAPIPFFYLVPSGPTTVPTVVPTTSGAAYQFWVDPSGVNAPDCMTNPMGRPINGACIGSYGNSVGIFATSSLTITAFNQIQVGSGNSFNLKSTGELDIFTGDGLNGNTTPFEAGTLTIANSGSGPGDLSVETGDSTNTDLQPVPNQVPQVLAIAVPEPGSLLLFGAGLGGLAAVPRARRTRML